MNDTLYLTGPYAPADKDWLHCEVQRVEPAGVHIQVQCGYSKQRMFFPMQQIQRIEYGNQTR